MALICVLKAFLLHICISYVHGHDFSKVCKRIYFQTNEYSNLNPSNVTKQLINNNIFVKFRWIQNNIPVYKAERLPLFFVYETRENKFVFSTSLYGRGYNATFPSGNRHKIIRKRWLVSANNATLPLGKDIFIGNQGFRPICVSQYLMAFCGFSQPIYFTLLVRQNNITYNNPVVDSFEVIPDIFVNKRPVYKHTNFKVTNWYLFYDKFAWYIGTNYNIPRGSFKSIDSATRPELITNSWRHHGVSGWVTYPLSEVRFQCRGIKTPCSQGRRCRNGGRCYLNTLNESVCACKLGWTGSHCRKQVKKCDAIVDTQHFEMERGMIWSGDDPLRLPQLCSADGWQEISPFFDIVEPDDSSDEEVARERRSLPWCTWSRARRSDSSSCRIDWSMWSDSGSRYRRYRRRSSWSRWSPPTSPPEPTNKYYKNDLKMHHAIICLAAFLPFCCPCMYFCLLCCDMMCDDEGEYINLGSLCFTICSGHVYIGEQTLFFMINLLKCPVFKFLIFQIQYSKYP